MTDFYPPPKEAYMSWRYPFSIDSWLYPPWNQPSSWRMWLNKLSFLFGPGNFSTHSFDSFLSIFCRHIRIEYLHRIWKLEVETTKLVPPSHMHLGWQLHKRAPLIWQIYRSTVWSLDIQQLGTSRFLHNASPWNMNISKSIGGILLCQLHNMLDMKTQKRPPEKSKRSKIDYCYNMLNQTLGSVA